MQLNSKVYDWLKWVVLVLLPMSGALYFLLKLPASESVTAILLGVIAFLGIVLQIASAGYKADGQMIVIPDPTGKDKITYSMELEGDPEELQYLDTVTFKVRRPPKMRK